MDANTAHRIGQAVKLAEQRVQAILQELRGTHGLVIDDVGVDAETLAVKIYTSGDVGGDPAVLTCQECGNQFSEAAPHTHVTPTMQHCHPLDEDGWYDVAELIGVRPFHVVFRRSAGGAIEITGGNDDRAEAEVMRDLYQAEYDRLRPWYQSLATDADRAYARQRYGL